METPILQLIAYVSLTLASVIVSGVSLFIGYRQNFGWKPILILTMRGDALIPLSKKKLRFSKKHCLSLVTFEVWNRRKYPIALRNVEINFLDRKVARGPVPGVESSEWQSWNNAASCTVGNNFLLLGPNEHKIFNARIPFDYPKNKGSLHEDALEVLVGYFDPISDKHVELKVPGTFRYEKNLQVRN